MPLEISGEITPEKKEQMEPKQKQHPVVDVTRDGSKVWCCKEQYCIGTWSVRYMNKANWKWSNWRWQEWFWDFTTQWNKWTGMGEFNLDDYYIYYCGQESLRRNGVAIIANKRVRNAILEWISKMTKDLCSFPRQTFNVRVIQVYVPTSSAKEAEAEWFYEDLEDLIELIHTKKMSFSL